MFHVFQISKARQKTAKGLKAMGCLKNVFLGLDMGHTLLMLALTLLEESNGNDRNK